MNFLKFQNKFKNNNIISKKEIILHFPNFDNKNLTYWQKKWYLIKIINNFYCYSDKNFNLQNLFYISNNIYQPSYISSYSALNYYWIIPEQVIQITWITTNLTKSYKTELWNFKYHNLKKELFWWYEVKKFKNTDYFIADIEKTILDFFYLNKNYKTKEDIEELRFNLGLLKEKINIKKLKLYLEKFSNKPLKKTISILIELIQNA